MADAWDFNALAGLFFAVALVVSVVAALALASISRLARAHGRTLLDTLWTSFRAKPLSRPSGSVTYSLGRRPSRPRNSSGSTPDPEPQATPAPAGQSQRKTIVPTAEDRKHGPFEWEIEWKRLQLQRLIGRGNFGEVWLSSWLGSPVAVKTLLPSLQSDKAVVKRFIDEIFMQSALHHPNVVMFMGACLQPPNVCLVLEHCVHGSLHEFLRSESTHSIRITMSLVYRFAVDIARGVKYLHNKQNIVQRDLKARNVLVDASLNAKVSDFGLSRVMTETGADGNLTACGTPAWTAPEIVRMEAYTDKVDVYSFGIILWELITRQEPYGGKRGVQIAYAAAEQGKRPEIPSYVPRNYSVLMQECWADRPADRPTFNQILKRLFAMKKEADHIAHEVTARIAPSKEGSKDGSQASLHDDEPRSPFGAAGSTSAVSAAHSDAFRQHFGSLSAMASGAKRSHRPSLCTSRPMGEILDEDAVSSADHDGTDDAIENAKQLLRLGTTDADLQAPEFGSEWGIVDGDDETDPGLPGAAAAAAGAAARRRPSAAVGSAMPSVPAAAPDTPVHPPPKIVQRAVRVAPAPPTGIRLEGAALADGTP